MPASATRATRDDRNSDGKFKPRKTEVRDPELSNFARSRERAADGKFKPRRLRSEEKWPLKVRGDAHSTVCSAVTNGTRLHVERPGGKRPPNSGAWARRFRDIFTQIMIDLGGDPSRLSEGQRQLARRCAMLSVECERMEASGVGGEQINLDHYGKLTDRLGRAFQRLGLKRRKRDVTPTVGAMIIDAQESGDA